MDGFDFKYLIVGIALTVTGLLINIYLKKTGLNDLRKILGIGIFWLKFWGYAFLIGGVIITILMLLSYYFYLQSI